MSSSRLSPLRHRVDARIALTTSLAVGVLVSSILVLLWLRTGYEALEQRDREIAGEAHSIASRIASKPGPPSASDLAAVARPSELAQYLCEITVAGGPRYRSPGWPSDEHRWLTALHPASPVVAYTKDYRVRTHEFSGGVVVRLAASLSTYRLDQNEVAGQVGGSILIGWLGAALVALLVTRRALEPLVSTTAAIEGVNAAQLSARLPLRGADDALDRHASALNRVLARLEWAFARMGAFSADVAHELRTPLNRLANVVEVALLEGRTDADRTRALERVHETVLQMQRLVDSLLLLARGEEGRLPLARKSQDLRKLVDNLLDLYEALATERDVRLSLSGPPLEASVDTDLFERALGNVLENALRSAPAGSEIRAQLSRDGDTAVVAVEDQGPGIPREERARVFERFVRLSTSATGTGSGLGLPIVRMILELHGGSVGIEDGSSGGARIVLRVPLAVPLAPAVARAAPAQGREITSTLAPTLTAPGSQTRQ
jgi:heavy metal sensor kinase